MKEEIYPHRRTRDDNGDQKFNLSEFVKKLGPGYSDAYQDISEVENYRLGSYFEGLNYPQVLQKILSRARETGLPRENIIEFLQGSDIWAHLNERQRKEFLNDTGTFKLPDTKYLKKNLILDIRRDVKDETKNIDIVLNTGLSAFTGNPINLAVVAKSSEGKTYMVTRTLSKFPKKYVIMLRKASPKTFTRERGMLAVRIVDGNSESYETEIENEFTGKKVSVSEYLEYLNARTEPSKKSKSKNHKESEENTDGPDDIDPEDAKIALAKLQANLYTLIDFRNKILVFLDRPDPALWNEMLSVLSHDQDYIVTSFVEGEGRKYVKKVVFRGWPAVIFCTSKDEDFNWKDLETRFQIIEPVMTAKKYTDAVNLAIENEFAIQETDRSSSETERLGKLIEWMIANRPSTKTPFPPKKLSDAITGGEVSSGDLMRKIPRILRHVSMNTLFNLSERVLWYNGNQVFVIVAYRDIMSLVFLFDDLELGASLSGMGTTLFEFLTQVVAPAFEDAPDESTSIRQKEIQDRFFEYLSLCKRNGRVSHLGTTKESFARYMKDLESRGYVKRDKDENDKRGLKVIPTWSELPQTISLSERLKKLVTPMQIADLPNMAYLESQNFTAFLKGQKLVTAYPGDIEYEKIQFPETLEFIGSTLQHSGYGTITSDHAVTNFNNIADSEIKTENTAFADNSKNDITQKPSIPYGVTNFSTNQNTPLKNDSPHSPELQGEPSNSDVQNEKSLWRVNPKKALFDLVEIESPKARYHSLSPKEIFDMIPDPEMTAKRVYELCEQLTEEGAFLRKGVGSYCVNIEFLNGGGYQ